ADRAAGGDRPRVRVGALILGLRVVERTERHHQLVPLRTGCEWLVLVEATPAKVHEGVHAGRGLVSIRAGSCLVSAERLVRPVALAVEVDELDLAAVELEVLVCPPDE